MCIFVCTCTWHVYTWDMAWICVKAYTATCTATCTATRTATHTAYVSMRHGLNMREGTHCNMHCNMHCNTHCNTHCICIHETWLEREASCTSKDAIIWCRNANPLAATIYTHAHTHIYIYIYVYICVYIWRGIYMNETWLAYEASCKFNDAITCYPSQFNPFGCHHVHTRTYIYTYTYMYIYVYTYGVTNMNETWLAYEASCTSNDAITCCPSQFNPFLDATIYTRTHIYVYIYICIYMYIYVVCTRIKQGVCMWSRMSPPTQ